MTSKEFRESVRFVRTNFFPRWDRKNAWRIQLGTIDGFDGECHWDGKKILVNKSLNRKETLVVLIHEFAHAAVRVAGELDHGTKWQNRMTKAAERAAEIGEKDLAKSLFKDIKEY